MYLILVNRVNYFGPVFSSILRLFDYLAYTNSVYYLKGLLVRYT